MDIKKVSILTMSLLCTSMVHQRLITVSAQEESPIKTISPEEVNEVNDYKEDETTANVKVEKAGIESADSVINREEDAGNFSEVEGETAINEMLESSAEEIGDDQAEKKSVDADKVNPESRVMTSEEAGISNETQGGSPTEEVEENEKSITIADVEEAISQAVFAKVNELRVKNGLNPLQEDSRLKEAAKKLVKEKPIGQDFIAEHGDTHALDTETANQAGYNSDFVPANHLYTEVRSEEIEKLGLEGMAARFVNKWFLDQSNPDLAHRRQMLIKEWDHTGVGVLLNPKTLIGEFKQSYIKSKFGDTITSETKLNLYDGFEIHVSQLFGNLKKQGQYTETEKPLSLADYSEYISGQIGQEEFNPQNGSYVTLSQRQAQAEIRRQEKINQDKQVSDNQTDPFVLVSDYTEEELLSHLNAIRSEVSEDLSGSELEERVISRLSDQFDQTNFADRKIMEIYHNDTKLGNWKLIQEGTQLSLSPYQADSHALTILDKEFSANKANIFQTEEEAVAFAKKKIKGHEENYYFTIVKMRDGNYSAWFPEKSILTNKEKFVIEHTYLFEEDMDNLIFDLKTIFKDINVEKISFVNEFATEILGKKIYSYRLLINDSTPMKESNETSLNIPERYFGKGLLLEHNGKAKIQDDLREISDYLNVPYAEVKDLPYDRKYLGGIISPVEPFYEGMTYFGFLTESYYIFKNYDVYYSDTEVMKDPPANIPDNLAVKNGYINGSGYHYYFTYPKWIEEKIYYSEEEIKEAIKRLPRGYSYSIHEVHPEDSMNKDEIEGYEIDVWGVQDINIPTIIERPDKVNAYGFNSLDEIKKDVLKYIVSDRRQTYRYDIFKLGNVYTVSYHNKLRDVKENENYFTSFDQAKTSAEKHIKNNPEKFYDIFKVDETYVVRYGENRLDTRWTPDSIHFTSIEEAEKFAAYVSMQVRSYDYDINPDRNGFYKLKTNSILFFDDQDGLYLIPEYIASGNSGILGDNYLTSSHNLTDIYHQFRVNIEVPTIDEPADGLGQLNSDDHFTPIQKPSQAGNKVKLPLTPKAPSSNSDINQGVSEGISPQWQDIVPTVYAEDYSTVNSTDTLQNVLQRIWLVLQGQAKKEVKEGRITDLFEVLENLAETIYQQFDLLFRIEFIFEDEAEKELKELAQVEVILFDGQEVDKLYRFDEDKQEVKETLDFKVEERPLNTLSEEQQLALTGYVTGNSVRILTFEIKEEGSFAVEFKDLNQDEDNE
ncbi:CAP domain-containing protein [Facklamia sp. P12945]|uniref:CAP domain-containing protein n=1 Tax=Facklamia sp. P12945 TaxID=3421950 RepID=UPI003D164B6B